MNQLIRYEFEFIFDSKNAIFLVVRGFFENELIDLNLAKMMQFLYQHEDQLSESDNDFCYTLVRLLKKTTISFQSKEHGL